MLDEPFRRWLARTGAAPAREMHRLGVPANAITMGALVLAILASLLIAAGRPVSGISLWLASRVLDGYDGMVARMSGRSSLFGGFLDITVDMLAYSAMAVAFAYARPDQWFLWLVVVVGYVMVTTTTLALSSLLERASRSVAGDRSIQFTPALAEAGETSVVYVLLVVWPGASQAVLLLWIALLAITTVDRTRLAARILR